MLKITLLMKLFDIWSWRHIFTPSFIVWSLFILLINLISGLGRLLNVANYTHIFWRVTNLRSYHFIARIVFNEIWVCITILLNNLLSHHNIWFFSITFMSLFFDTARSFYHLTYFFIYWNYNHSCIYYLSQLPHL